MKKKIIYALIVAALSISLFGCGNQKIDPNKLTVLNYGKYIDPNVIKMFEKETGITVEYEEYESPEEMYAKYKAGSIDYDLACTSDYMVQKLINEKEQSELAINAHRSLISELKREINEVQCVIQEIK